MPRMSGMHISQGSMHLLYEHQRQCEHIRACCLKGACDMAQQPVQDAGLVVSRLRN